MTSNCTVKDAVVDLKIKVIYVTEICLQKVAAKQEILLAQVNISHTKSQCYMHVCMQISLNLSSEKVWSNETNVQVVLRKCVVRRGQEQCRLREKSHRIWLLNVTEKVAWNFVHLNLFVLPALTGKTQRGRFVVCCENTVIFGSTFLMLRWISTKVGS